MIGETIIYTGNDEPLNWIICDGVDRNNEDNIYDSLIEIGIGTKNGNYYIPPNYCNTVMAGINDSDSLILKQIASNVNADERCDGMHVYRMDYRFVTDYNNVYTNVLYNQMKYLDISCNSTSLVNDYANPINVNKKYIRWLIRYKAD